MQWNGDRNAGFSLANPQKLVLPPVQDPEYHFSAVNVEVQQSNSSSLLWWTKRIIALRKNFSAFGRGTFEPLFPKNRRVLAFLRRHADEVILVVVNLSRFAQYVELDLSEFNGRRPRELFGNIDFPAIGELPYLVTLGPHGFYWLSLSSTDTNEETAPRPSLHQASVRGDWESLFSGRSSQALSAALADYLPTQRWFRGKARKIKATRVTDSMPLSQKTRLLVVDVQYTRGDPESYLLPLRFVPDFPSGEHAVCALRVRGKSRETEGFLVDCSQDEDVASALLRLVVSKKRLNGRQASIAGVPAPELRKRKDDGELPRGQSLGAEQSNTSYVYGDEIVGKLLRKVEQGTSVELSALHHLASADPPANVPAYLGHIELS
jgi:maltose alpha-D-glucosyltransferase/alpha-amylase